MEVRCEEECVFESRIGVLGWERGVGTRRCHDEGSRSTYALRMTRIGHGDDEQTGRLSS